MTDRERGKPSSPPGQDKPKPNDPEVEQPIYTPPGKSDSPEHGGQGDPDEEDDSLDTDEDEEEEET